MKNKAKKSLAEKSGQKRFSKAQIQAMKKDVQSTGVKKQKKMKWVPPLYLLFVATLYTLTN